MKKTFIFLILLLSLTLTGFVSSARADKASLTDIVVTNTWDHLLIYFTVTDCFTEEMKKAIENGINTTFTFFINLNEVQDFWWDKRVTTVEVSHDINYDSLKKIYTVKLSERDGEIITVKDFEEAKKLMSEIVGLKVAEMKNLTKGTRYRVRMMAELDTIELPLYLHYVLFFLSLWDFETEWYTVDFNY